MTQNYTILFFILSGCLLTSCSKKEKTQLNQTIERAIKLAEDRPDKALTILDSIGTPKNSDKKNFMLYQIAQVRARRNSGLPLDSTLIENITLAVKYFEKRKDAKNAAIANFYAARAYAYQENTESEFYYYLKSLPYAEAAKDSTTMSKSLFNLGCIYFDQQVYDSTEVYLKKSIPLLRHYPNLQAEGYRLLTLSNLICGNIDSASAYLNQGIFIFNKIENKDKSLVYNYNSMCGFAYKITSRYDESIMYLRKNLKPEAPTIEQVRATLNLIDVYRLTQNNDSATYYANKVIPILQNMEIKNLDDEYLLCFGYRVIRDYYVTQNDLDAIAKYAKLEKDKDLEIRNTNIKEQLLFIKNQITIKNIEELNKEQKRRFVVYTIIFCLLTFSIILVLIYKYLKRKEAKSIHQKINEIEMLQSKLNSMRKNQNLEQSF